MAERHTIGGFNDPAPIRPSLQHAIVPPFWTELSPTEQSNYINAWRETLAKTKDVGKSLTAALDTLKGTKFWDAVEVTGEKTNG